MIVEITMRIPIGSIVLSAVGLRHDRSHHDACKKWVKSVDHIFLDRIDIQVEVESVPFEDISKDPKGEPSSAIRERVLQARKVQEERYKSIRGIYCNAQMTTSLLQQHMQLDDQALTMLRTAMKKLNLSARAYDRILKVSRAIADLSGSKNVTGQHIAEAIGYRNLDRDGWTE